MNLTTAAQAIAIRFDLTRDEWIELVDAVTQSIDMPGEKLPPMTAALAKKLGVYTLREAVSMVFAKRFSGPPSTPVEEPEVHEEPPPARIERVTIQGREVVRKARACSFCRREGHQQRTCPELGFARKKQKRKPWQGSDAGR